MNRVFDHEPSLVDCARADPHEHVGRNNLGPIIRWLAVPSAVHAYMDEIQAASDAAHAAAIRTTQPEPRVVTDKTVADLIANGAGQGLIEQAEAAVTPEAGETTK